jgi:hypothetical protein
MGTSWLSVKGTILLGKLFLLVLKESWNRTLSLDATD